ncbi:MAG: FAD synthetase family protein [Sedimentibacter sp.]|uniref:FAD synthetase family protein n=1 Tax=Sedimentibacter sp. TaxID=1960295 RepID=UPI002981D2C6|nr:FAD synthetase family protein [Sedimentibacter sp.]MDW5300700.1 FAD synthetase family protein [Sedimentibacter sp.]
MERNNASCVAIGNFDGIHIGHDTLIRRMIDLSHETNQDSIIITFKFIKKDLKKSTFNIKYINSQNTKLEILKEYNVTEVVEIELDDVVSKYSQEQFISEILIGKYNAKNIVVGYNFSFGYKASGNIITLKGFEEKYGYEVEEIYPVKYNGILVSSTLVRSLLKEGKIHEANNLLVNNYTIFHEEIEMDYNKNICFVDNKSSIIVPADGRYSVMVGGKKVVLTVITNKSGSVFTFDKIIDKSQNIIFLDKAV